MHGKLPDAHEVATNAMATVRQQSPRQIGRGEISPDLCNFAMAVRKAFKIKAAAAIQQYSGRPDRTCRDWESDRTPAPAYVAFAILRGDEGFLLLHAVMSESPPDWWVNYERHRKLGADIEQRVMGKYQPS